MNKPLSIQELAALAAQTEDQTVETTATFDNDPPEAGVTIGRFIEYIELGKHPQKAYKGKEKADSDMVRLTFELLHPKKNIKEYEDENKEKRVRGELVSVTVSKKTGSDKSSFTKIRKVMTYGRDDIKHMAQMLGEPFLITIYHNVVEADGVKKTYVNLHEDGVYGISAPFVLDPLEGTKTPVPVRDAIKPLRLFLWENPTKETWDSLFIDGTREVKKDGGVVEHVSKNWLQERIMSATNYSGSPLNVMLGGLAELPTEETDVPAKEDTKQTAAKVNTAATKATDKPAAAKAQTVAAKKAAPVKSASTDALAALGLS